MQVAVRSVTRVLVAVGKSVGATTRPDYRVARLRWQRDRTVNSGRRETVYGGAGGRAAKGEIILVPIR